jgi:hypothetical protein
MTGEASPDAGFAKPEAVQRIQMFVDNNEECGSLHGVNASLSDISSKLEE